MFFDYPASESLMSEILQKTGAKVFHFMNYNNKKIDVQDLIKNISGMLKYVCTNKNGEINLCEISDFLSISDEVTELCFDILENLGMIQTVEKNMQECKIKFLHAVEFSKIKEHDMYDVLENETEKIYNYRQSLCTMPLEEIFIH